MTYKVLSPLQFSGSVHGDYGYEIDGVKSAMGYVSKSGAEKAMHRKLDKLEAEAEAKVLADAVDEYESTLKA